MALQKLARNELDLRNAQKINELSIVATKTIVSLEELLIVVKDLRERLAELQISSTASVETITEMKNQMGDYNKTTACTITEKYELLRNIILDAFNIINNKS